MTRRNNDLFALERIRHSVNAEQPMAVPESAETTGDTSDSADELCTPVLNLNKAAFTFVSDSQFTHSRYALDICRSIEAICEEYKPLKVILPTLAEGFQRQKGEIFWFGSYNENSHSLSTWIKIS